MNNKRTDIHCDVFVHGGNMRVNDCLDGKGADPFVSIRVGKCTLYLPDLKTAEELGDHINAAVDLFKVKEVLGA